MTTQPYTQSIDDELVDLFNRAGLSINYDDDEDPTAQLIHEVRTITDRHVREAWEQGVKDAYVAIDDVERLHMFNDGDEVIAQLSNIPKVEKL